MTSTSTEITVPTAARLFKPLEHAILSHWLGVAPPPGTPNIGSLPFDDDDDSYIGLSSDNLGARNLGPAVSNAIARICLNPVRRRLPQWRCVDGPTGRIKLVAAYWSQGSGNGGVEPLPQLLFEINWKNVGPGISGYAAYHAVFLPYYDVTVVTTTSRDSRNADAYGVRAEGYFKWNRPDDYDPIAGAKTIIVGSWRDRHEEYAPGRWGEVTQFGLVLPYEIESWAEEAWGEPTKDHRESGSLNRLSKQRNACRWLAIP